ncbi:MAG: hypothetical protein P8X73_13450 [Ignavibacteriaceae bacterium]
MRKNNCAEKYLRDFIDFFNEHEFHWAFYSFREDEWDENPPLLRKDQDLFDAIKNQFD